MKRLFAIFAAVLAAVALAACGSSGAKADGAGHNAADVMFAQNMITHHRQAIAMAGLAATRASSPKVKELASRIEKAQDPEITTMTGWLNAWHEPTPAPSAAPGMGGMSGMHHGGASTMPMASGTPGGGMSMSGMPMATATPSTTSHPPMAGMMSDEDMTKLAASSGRDFDRMFLTMMIAHHRGAVTMATAEERDGQYGPAKQLATRIRTSQTAEITEMNGLLTTI
jgi:uncharacterized protein (DUF305 family)